MDETKETHRGLWYFAHPYTCKDKNGNYLPEGEEANYNICNARAADLLEAGYNIYSPISMTHGIYRASPSFISSQEHALWYALDNEFIELTKWSGIILAPGWERSSGCVAERKRITDKGLPALLYIDIMMGVVQRARFSQSSSPQAKCFLRMSAEMGYYLNTIVNVENLQSLTKNARLSFLTSGLQIAYTANKLYSKKKSPVFSEASAWPTRVTRRQFTYIAREWLKVNMPEKKK